MPRVVYIEGQTNFLAPEVTMQWLNVSSVKLGIQSLIPQF